MEATEFSVTNRYQNDLGDVAQKSDKIEFLFIR